MSTLSRRHKCASACVRCRAKKLKCDPSQGSCTNCERIGEICVEVDHKSGRQYERAHLEKLRQRVSYLRQRLREQHSQPQGGKQPVADAAARQAETSCSRGYPSIQPWKAMRDVSDGSILRASVTDNHESLGNLISAAVSVHFPIGLGDHVERSSLQLHDPAITGPAPIQDLPPLSIACELINYYFEMGFQKVSPFMRRSEVFEQVERLYDNRIAAVSHTTRRNDMFQLFMVFAVATSSVRPTHNDRPSPIAYYATAMQHSDVLTQPAGIDLIQNTLLLLVFTHHHDVGIGSKWKLARQAMRACIQLGYHKAPVRPLDFVTEQVQRRLFWCCYVQERFAACNLARPIVISDSEITVDMPDDIHLDNVGNGQRPSLIPVVESEVSVLIRQAELRKISTKVRQELYTRKNSNAEAIAHKELLASQLDAELTQWRIKHIGKGTLPLSQCVYDATEYVDINFHRERLFIFSALAVPEELRKSSFQPDLKHLKYCLESAVQLVRSLKVLLDRGVAIPLWTQVQDVLRSGFMILYCGIHLPLFLSSIGQAGGISNTPAIQAISEPSVIVRYIDDCLQMLEDMSHHWPAVNSHRIAFDRLSCEVKRLTQGIFPADHALVSEQEGRGQLPLESTFWDAPMDLTEWNDLLDGDLDMQAVFGNDFDISPLSDASFLM